MCIYGGHYGIRVVSLALRGSKKHAHGCGFSSNPPSATITGTTNHRPSTIASNTASRVYLSSP